MVGAAMLQASREIPVEGAAWQSYTHGGAIEVVSAYPDLFERRLICLPRPEGDAEAWRARSDRRLKCLDTHLQAHSMGRIVSQASLDLGEMVVLMIRRGVPLHRLKDGDLDERAVANLLRTFLEDLDRYLSLTRDTDLIHLTAIEVARIPKKGEPSNLRLKLDAMALVTGLGGEATPLTPDELLAGICRIWARSINGWGRIGTPEVALIGPWLAHRRAVELSRSLSGLAQRLERGQPSRREVEAWIRGLA